MINIDQLRDPKPYLDLLSVHANTANKAVCLCFGEEGTKSGQVLSPIDLPICACNFPILSQTNSLLLCRPPSLSQTVKSHNILAHLRTWPPRPSVSYRKRNTRQRLLVQLHVRRQFHSAVTSNGFTSQMTANS